MIDETDLGEEMKQFHEERGRTVVNNLQKRNISAQYVPSKEEASDPGFAVVASLTSRTRSRGYHCKNPLNSAASSKGLLPYDSPQLAARGKQSVRMRWLQELLQ